MLTAHPLAAGYLLVSEVGQGLLDVTDREGPRARLRPDAQELRQDAACETAHAQACADCTEAERGALAGGTISSREARE